MSGIKRGDIFYIEKQPVTGSEVFSGRPAIIVSNNMINETAAVLEVVYLTTQPKGDMSTHVPITSIPKVSTALCEQITSVARVRIGDWHGRVSEEEMRQIEAAMRKSLGMDYAVDNGSQPEREDYAKILYERNLYKGLFEHTLDSVAPAGETGGKL